MKNAIKIALPILIIIIAFAAFKWQMANRPQAKKSPKKKMIPVVRAVKAENTDYSYSVRGFGTVQSAGSVSVVSQVGGKVIWVNPKLKSGVSFRKGDILYKLGATDYRANLASAESSLKVALVDLQKIEEEAQISLKEWEIWNGANKNTPSPLVSYKPQLESAKAKVDSAKSSVEKAKADLGRTVYYAPFDCVVSSESIEIGKIVRAGESSGELIRSDEYEVVFPLFAGDALRLNFGGKSSSKAVVTLDEEVMKWSWEGELSRLIPDSDSKTGMLQGVVTVDSSGVGKSNPILPIGAVMTVDVFSIDSVESSKIPEAALREGHVVWVFAGGKIQIRDVKVIDNKDGLVYIKEGLSADDMVVISSLDGVVDGMKVKLGGRK